MNSLPPAMPNRMAQITRPWQLYPWLQCVQGNSDSHSLPTIKVDASIHPRTHARGSIRENRCRGISPSVQVLTEPVRRKTEGLMRCEVNQGKTRAHFADIESLAHGQEPECALDSLACRIFFRRTGVHFGGKCFNAEEVFGSNRLRRRSRTIAEIQVDKSKNSD